MYSAITPKSEDRYVVKVFNWSEVNLSEITCYKIHTLVALTSNTRSYLGILPLGTTKALSYSFLRKDTNKPRIFYFKKTDFETANKRSNLLIQTAKPFAFSKPICQRNNYRSKAGKVSSQTNYSVDSSPIEHKSCIDFWCQSKVQIGCKIDRHQKNWEEI